ncbi:MAG TPA: hypothetical protein VLE48_02880 [Terriglobales bacterium]|nr:hypothetical protein [Terriglobales bacterium]
MPEAEQSTQQGRSDDLPEGFEHPRGTLAIVIMFGLLFGLGWLGMYLFLFLGRGSPHP